MRLAAAVISFAGILAALSTGASAALVELDPYAMQEAFCKFPFAQVVPLDGGAAWGLMYADTYGKAHLLRATEKGWKLEWEVTNLASRIKKFFVQDVDADGTLDVLIATVSGRIVVYSMDGYRLVWENLEDRYSIISAIDVSNIDSDPQPEIILLADTRLLIIDGQSKTRQWLSDRSFEASEIIVANIDKDPQTEIVLNTGLILDSRFFNIEVEWDRPFGDRIMVFDINSDGFPEIVGEFADYSLRIFDVYARCEVW